MSTSTKGEGHGEKRSYYGGGKAKGKIPKNYFDAGEEIMYRSGGLVKYGRVLSADECIIEREGNQHVLDKSHNPVSLQRQRFNDISNLHVGSTIFILKQADTGNVFKLCNVIFCMDEEHLWVKLKDDENIEMSPLSQLFAIPSKYTEYRKKLSDIDDPTVQILKFMCDMVDDLKLTNSSLPQLHTQLSFSQQQLGETQTQIQNMKDQYNKLHETFTSQQAQINDMTNTIAQLSHVNNTLNKQLQQTQHALDIEKAKTPLLLEKQSAPEGVLRTRAKGSTGKFVTSVIVTQPSHSRPSAGAFKATLDKRVSDLKKVWFFAPSILQNS